MRRSLDSVFDPPLWDVGALALRGRRRRPATARCAAALQRFDGVDARPGELRVPDAELDGRRRRSSRPSCATRSTHDRRARALQRAGPARRRLERGDRAGRRRRRARRADRLGGALRALRQGLLPVGHGAPRRAGGRRGRARRSSCSARRCRDSDASIRRTSTSPRSSGCARSAASTARAASRPRCSAPPRSRACARSSARAALPVTVAQLLAAEHGVVTNMLQGPSESLIIADDSRRPRAARRRPR